MDKNPINTEVEDKYTVGGGVNINSNGISSRGITLTVYDGRSNLYKRSFRIRKGVGRD